MSGSIPTRVHVSLPGRRSTRLFMIVLVFIGAAMALYGGVRAVDGAATSGWTETTATIVSAEVRSSERDDDGDLRHSYLVTAEYVVDGERYTLQYRTNDTKTEPRIGREIPIRYNPADPADARRGEGGAAVVIGGVMAGIGVVLAVVGVVVLVRMRRGAARDGAGAPEGGAAP